MSAPVEYSPHAPVENAPGSAEQALGGRVGRLPGWLTCAVEPGGGSVVDVEQWAEMRPDALRRRNRRAQGQLLHGLKNRDLVRPTSD